MARLHAEGHAIRQIAATLDRAPSTVARSLKRNASSTQGYQPGYADKQARARRWQGSKLDRDRPLRDAVLARLQHGWSPQQAAGRPAQECQQPVISHETIYRFIYARSPARKITLGATIRPGPKPNAGAVATKAAARHPSSPCAARWPRGRTPSRIAVPPVTGRPA